MEMVCNGMILVSYHHTSYSSTLNTCFIDFILGGNVNITSGSSAAKTSELICNGMILSPYLLLINTLNLCFIDFILGGTLALLSASAGESGDSGDVLISTGVSTERPGIRMVIHVLETLAQSK